MRYNFVSSQNAANNEMTGVAGASAKTLYKNKDQFKSYGNFLN